MADHIDETEYDVIILGTGVVETLLSGACARIGKRVLHLDASTTYGGTQATYSLDILHQILKSGKPTPSKPSQELPKDIPTELSVTPLSPPGSIPLLQNCKSDELVEENVGSNKELRRYNLDTIPRLLWARSPFIDVLIRAGTSRYLEFKCADHAYILCDNKIQQVPCSKGDIFKSKAVSLIEKRNLMKFIKLLTEESTDEAFKAELQEWSQRPFNEYLTHKKLSQTLQSFLLYSIAMLNSRNEMPTTQQGLELVYRFLHCMGIYGSTPWIYPLYGTGELSQAFARFAAVFGSIFVLNRYATHIVTDATQNEYRGIVCSVGQFFTSTYLVGNADHLPNYFTGPNKFISRAICITSTSIDPDKVDKFLFLVVPPDTFPGHSNAIYVLQLDSSEHVCPTGKYVVHLWTEGSSESQAAIEKLIQTFEANDAPVLWKCTFDINMRQVQSDIPKGVLTVSDPDPTIDMESALAEAQKLFSAMYPDEEFVPEVPRA